MATVAASKCANGSQLKRKMKGNTHHFIKTSMRVQVLHLDLSINTKRVALYCTVHKTLTHEAETQNVAFSPMAKFSHSTLSPLNYRAEMSSIFINDPSSSSSMKCTYPPTNKPSKQELKHGNCKPTRNKWTHPFVLRSSSPSLRLGRRCHHCGSLHSRVSFV